LLCVGISRLERSVRDRIDDRGSFIAGDETFTETPCEVVVGGFRLQLGDMAEAPRHPPLHFEPRDQPGEELRADDEFAPAGYLKRWRAIQNKTANSYVIDITL
jgi:hypothetical protein